MSLLIQMRQRIKAIETIKKVTHAMRLISMSAHSHLKHKEKAINNYKNSVSSLFGKLLTADHKKSNTMLAPNECSTGKHLIILVGSQKGLCGNFNTALFHFLEVKKSEQELRESAIITIGKKSHDYIKAKKTGSFIASFNEFNANNLIPMAHEITNLLLHTEKLYKSVTLFGNILVSFFIQRPSMQKLIPFEYESEKGKLEREALEKRLQDYIWDQPLQEVLMYLSEQYIEANLQQMLFQSLLAEHAARFISMDNSTRNAKNLLEKTKLDYNKLRQAKITKELAELVGSFN